VDIAINSRNPLSPAHLTDELYIAYNKLYNLSRRARYLIHEDPKNPDNSEFLTYSKHLEKAIKNLEKLLLFFKTNYGVAFDINKVKCVDLREKYKSDFFIII